MYDYESIIKYQPATACVGVLIHRLAGAVSNGRPLIQRTQPPRGSFVHLRCTICTHAIGGALLGKPV